MALSPITKKLDLLLQAEIPAHRQAWFESRYLKATRRRVSPGSPSHYQDQPNKRGAELRIYFNNAGRATRWRKAGFHVEEGRRGYLAGKYRYRINNNGLWWKLVERNRLRLGLN